MSENAFQHLTSKIKHPSTKALLDNAIAELYKRNPSLKQAFRMIKSPEEVALIEETDFLAKALQSLMEALILYKAYEVKLGYAFTDCEELVSLATDTSDCLFETGSSNNED